MCLGVLCKEKRECVIWARKRGQFEWAERTGKPWQDGFQEVHSWSTGRRWEDGIVRGEGSTGRVCGGVKARRSGAWTQTGLGQLCG